MVYRNSSGWWVATILCFRAYIEPMRRTAKTRLHTVAAILYNIFKTKKMHETECVFEAAFSLGAVVLGHIYSYIRCYLPKRCQCTILAHMHRIMLATSEACLYTPTSLFTDIRRESNENYVCESLCVCERESEHCWEEEANDTREMKKIHMCAVCSYRHA